MEQLKKIDFALVGVGGQGIILASDVLADVGLAAGYDVKKTDAHGMAQRGGSVVSFVRWAPVAYSPTPKRGEVDVLVALEKLEAARMADWLRPGGVAVVADQQLSPVSANSGQMKYPSDAQVIAALVSRTDRVALFAAPKIAQELGNPRVANVLLLGYTSSYLPLDAEIWRDTLRRLVPARILEINLAAFDRGRAAAMANIEIVA
jgi:indolepyruvate ferredoxin oxidoreductase, beta subunit